MSRFTPVLIQSDYIFKLVDLSQHSRLGTHDQVAIVGAELYRTQKKLQRPGREEAGRGS